MHNNNGTTGGSNQLRSLRGGGRYHPFNEIIIWNVVGVRIFWRACHIAFIVAFCIENYFGGKKLEHGYFF